MAASRPSTSVAASTVARSARWASAAGSGSGTRRRRASFALASHSAGASTPSRFTAVSIRNAWRSRSSARFKSASFLKSRARRIAHRAQALRVSESLGPSALTPFSSRSRSLATPLRSVTSQTSRSPSRLKTASINSDDPDRGLSSGRSL